MRTFIFIAFLLGNFAEGVQRTGGRGGPPLQTCFEELGSGERPVGVALRGHHPCVDFWADAIPQQPSSHTRAQELAATFDKQKSAVKAKRGMRMEKYKDVRNVPLVALEPSSHSGTYEIPDLGYVINIQVGSDGQVQASGSDSGRTFKLENARIDDALLLASKVFQDGTTEKFEAVFITRIERDFPTAPGVTKSGLGVVLTKPVEVGGVTYERLFYQLKQ